MASSATASPMVVATDLLICKICQLPYNEPKTLPCLHSFCRGCLVWIVRKYSVSSPDDKTTSFYCPLCRRLCEIPSARGGSSGVDSLPNEPLLRGLQSLVHSRDGIARSGRSGNGKASAASSAPSCDACREQAASRNSGRGSPVLMQRQTRRLVNATHCCIKCQELLCDACTAKHRTGRGTADHTVISVEALTEACQALTATQLNKPTITEKLITSFNVLHSTRAQPVGAGQGSGVGERDGRRDAAFGRDRRGMPGGRGSRSDEPVAVTVSKADSVVVSSVSGTVRVYSLDGTLSKELDQGLDHFSENNCICLTAEGYIAMATPGKLSDEYSVRGNQAGSQVKVPDQVVAVVKSFGGRVNQTLTLPPLALSSAPGLFSSQQRSPPTPRPYGLAVTLNGHTVISDVGRHCIYLFDTTGRLLKQFGKYGVRDCQFKSPYFVSVTSCAAVTAAADAAVSKTRIVVSDYGNHFVKVFDLNGRFRCKMGGCGREEGRLCHPRGVCTDRYDNIFVCDRDNHRVQMFDRKGKFISKVLTTIDMESGLDARPEDVSTTSQSLLVVLVTGVEGVTYAHICIYQLRCSLPPPAARDVRDVISRVRALDGGSISRSMATSSIRSNGAQHADDVAATRLAPIHYENGEDTRRSKKVVRIQEADDYIGKMVTPDLLRRMSHGRAEKELHENEEKSSICVIL